MYDARGDNAAAAAVTRSISVFNILPRVISSYAAALSSARLRETRKKIKPPCDAEGHQSPR